MFSKIAIALTLAVAANASVVPTPKPKVKVDKINSSFNGGLASEAAWKNYREGNSVHMKSSKALRALRAKAVLAYFAARTKSIAADKGAKKERASAGKANAHMILAKGESDSSSAAWGKAKVAEKGAKKAHKAAISNAARIAAGVAATTG